MMSVQQTAGDAVCTGLPRVPDGRRLYAVGDVHGRADLLHDMHRRIVRDAENSPEWRTIVYIGDYVDRGNDSAEVVRLLIEEPLEGFETIHLRGNHEDLMSAFLGGRRWGDGWLDNGGENTLHSYGIDVPPFYWRPEAVLEMRRRLAEALPEAHIRFLASLRLIHVEEDYAFVHAGIRPEVPLDKQDPFDLMWIRSGFLDADGPFEKVVVHGHTITPAPEVLPHRVGIDTGAYRTGRLTCLVLEGTERRFLQT